MILWFSGTGNCLAIARKIADQTGEQLMSIYDAQQAEYQTQRLNPQIAILSPKGLGH